ncbi:MAG: hypothetical protein ABSG43_06150 [Solirubrobacteraceae bacterium]|jgi:capsular polysaccharide biosynthesis protein
MSDVESKPTRPTWAARALASEFEPLPRIGLLESVRRYWYLAALPIIVFVAVAAAAGEKRTPHYTAEARLMVGRLNISTPGAVAGFAQAAQDLAAAYPLVIDATGVIDPLAKQFHTTPGNIRNEISSSQVPSSPIIRVFATGATSKFVIRLANAASNQLVTYLTTFNQDNPDATRLLKEDQAAQLVYERDLANLQAVSKHSGPLSPQNQKLAAAVDVDKLETTGLGNDYQLTLQTSAVTSLLQPLQFADTATSDKKSKLEIAVFAALVAGLIAGLGLATLRANVIARRALTAPSWQPEFGAVADDGHRASAPAGAGESAGDGPAPPTTGPPAD